tara:strand:- start:386 stop:967 length:582 start_codon:yes stop_codon:yes gene_type:complete
MTKFQWPHPTNAEFNEKIRSIVNMYGSAPPRDKELLISVKSFLKGCVENILKHKVKRDSEKYFELLNLKMTHGIEKPPQDRQKLILECNIVFFTGDWREYPDCVEDYRFASSYRKPMLEIFHKPYLQIEDTVRFLDPIRPIEDPTWNSSLAKDILVYQEPSGKYEVIDGNHRHEFAQRLGTVKTLSAWVIKDV